MESFSASKYNLYSVGFIQEKSSLPFSLSAKLTEFVWNASQFESEIKKNSHLSGLGSKYKHIGAIGSSGDYGIFKLDKEGVSDSCYSAPANFYSVAVRA